jgi:hypothetical protein
MVGLLWISRSLLEGNNNQGGFSRDSMKCSVFYYVARNIETSNEKKIWQWKYDFTKFGPAFQDFAIEIMNKWRDILYINEFSPIEKLPGQSMITGFWYYCLRIFSSNVWRRTCWRMNEFMIGKKRINNFGSLCQVYQRKTTYFPWFMYLWIQFNWI